MYMKKSTLIISCFAGISMVALAGCGDSNSGTDAKDAADEASEKYFPDIKSGSCDFKKRGQSMEIHVYCRGRWGRLRSCPLLHI